MNTEQKNSARELVAKYKAAGDEWGEAEVARELAALLQGLIDAPEPTVLAILLDSAQVEVHGTAHDLKLLAMQIGQWRNTTPLLAKWKMGAYVQKKQNSSWRGKVVGFYSTAATPIGYCVESHFEPGSVQVWPEAALIDWMSPS